MLYCIAGEVVEEQSDLNNVQRTLFNNLIRTIGHIPYLSVQSTQLSFLTQNSS